MAGEDEILLRKAEAGDVDDIIQLKYLVTTAGRTETPDDPVDPDWLEEALPELISRVGPSSFNNYVLAVMGGIVVGTICLNWFRAKNANALGKSAADELIALIPGSMFVSDMAVAVNSRRKGIARLLMQFAEQVSRDNKLKRIGLMVNSDNLPAIRLYERLGFRKKASRPMPAEPGAAQARELFLMTKMIKLAKYGPGFLFLYRAFDDICYDILFSLL